MITPSAPNVLTRWSSPELYVYEIAASAPLPMIDLSKSVRSVWFHPALGKLWLRFFKRYRRTVLQSYYVAIILYPLGFFLDASVGQWVALAATSLGIVGALGSISMLRADIVRLLLGMYEVWFFSLVNTLSSVLLAIYFRDVRALLMLPFWLGVQSSILLDANVTMARHFVLTSLMVVSFLVVLTAFIGLGVLNTTHSFVVLPSRVHELTAETALVNSWSTIILLLCRNMYRRREALKKLGAESKLVQCISYRVKIQLVRIRSTSIATTASLPPVPVRVASLCTAGVLAVPMLLVTAHERYDASNTVIPLSRLIPLTAPIPSWIRRIGVASSYVGFSLTLVDFAALGLGHSSYELNVAALAITATYVTMSLGLYQRQLLRRMVFSFDYAFLALQIGMAHVNVCDLFAWDSRSFCALASLLWVHWVLTFDAITPVMQRRWGIRVSFAGVIMAFFIAAQTAIAACIVLDVGIVFQDRSFLTIERWGHRVQFRTVPLLLSRMATLLGWSCRVLWRIWHRRGDELIIMQGGVLFESNMRSVRTNVAAAVAAMAVVGRHKDQLDDVKS